MQQRSWWQAPDLSAVALLILLWLLFFWRLFTPVAADQAAFRQGDFSGQFVAFGGYQYTRMAQGAIPLWNPYNNGGLPFIADTQAAVFYPPRWLTIALSQHAGGWSYNALQLEATAHVLLYALLMYMLVRRLTLGQPGSIYGAWVAAVIAAYGGFIAGYPPLQLALLEAVIWLPLAALGILEATRTSRIGWRGLLLAGVALGLSWLAGHPQSSWFMTYLLVFWLAYRCWVQAIGWRAGFSGLIVMGIVTFGVTAVTLLPGIEYLLLTARTDLGFAAKGNGFPFQDMAQFVFPGVVSLFSPLYVGLPALVLAYAALRARLPGAWFWGGVALIGLLHSLGANSVVYHALYNGLPGLRFFRGQERAALLVASSLAILAGLGAAYLAGNAPEVRHLRRAARGLLALVGAVTLLGFVAWVGAREAYGAFISATFLSLGVALALALLLEWSLARPVLALLAGLIVFELFSVHMDAPSNYDPRPAAEQLSLTPPPLVQTVLADPNQPFRVDGFRGVQANYGSLYGVADIRGISPLFLTSAQRIIYRDYGHNPLAWELFAVKYVYSERASFSTPTRVIAEGTDHDGAIFLHELLDPRPFAHLVYRADPVDSDEFAWALVSAPQYHPRESVVILGDPGIILPAAPPVGGTARVTAFHPEQIRIAVTTPTNALLSLAQVDYPGWYATLDGAPLPILRAYGALMALPIPAGDHHIELTYNPLSYRIGLILTLVTITGLAIIAVSSIVRRRPA